MWRMFVLTASLSVMLAGCAAYDSRVPDTRIPDEGPVTLPPEEAAIPDTREPGLPPEDARPDGPAPLPRDEPEVLVPEREPPREPGAPEDEAIVPPPDTPDDEDLPRPPDVTPREPWGEPDGETRVPDEPPPPATPSEEEGMPPAPPIRPGEPEVPPRERPMPHSGPGGALEPSAPELVLAQTRQPDSDVEADDEVPGVPRGRSPGVEPDPLQEGELDTETTVPRRERMPTGEHREFHPEPFADPEVEERPFDEDIQEWYGIPDDNGEDEEPWQ